MDIRQMQCFAQVAEKGSLNKAADALFVSRQALSKTIARLESEVGEPLLEIDRTGARLTLRGREFLQEITPLLQSYDKIESKFGTVKKPRSLQIALGKGSYYPFPADFISRFSKENGGVPVQIEEIHSVGVLQMVESGEAQIGILCSHPKYLAGFEMLSILHPGFALDVPLSNPLSKKDRIDLRDLEGVSLVSYGERNHLHRFLMEQCEIADVHPIVVATTSDDWTHLQAQLREDAVSFGCMPAFGDRSDSTRRIPFDMPGFDVFGTFAIRRADIAPSDLAQRFWRRIETFAAKLATTGARSSQGAKIEQG